MEEELFRAFEILVNRLSPENLSCDGELPRYEINCRRKRIMREWKVLEKRVGREVSIDEIEDESFRRLRERLGR